jgi:hypothetical protein
MSGEDSRDTVDNAGGRAVGDAEGRCECRALPGGKQWMNGIKALVLMKRNQSIGSPRNRWLSNRRRAVVEGRARGRTESATRDV